MRQRRSLLWRLAALLAAMFAAGALAATVVGTGLGHGRLPVLLAAGTLLALLIARWAMRPLRRVLRALAGAVCSYRDGDFSASLVRGSDDELGALVDLHNELGATLRTARQHLVERELMLDTVVQHTPTALVLTDATGRIALANLAAQQLFNDGSRMTGLAFTTLLESWPDAVQAHDDGLYSLTLEGVDETFHVSRRPIRLRGRVHALHLFRCMSREISRQEVASWKNAIRIVSHELNNALAPIASLAHSGTRVAQREGIAELDPLFQSIRARVDHLHGFVEGYARFARLPAPRITEQAWDDFLADLARQLGFRIDPCAPGGPGWFDRGQLEQVLTNLVGNAVEAGSPLDEIGVSVTRAGAMQWIDVVDRGSGMSDAVLQQATLPFYSTKRSGTGLGLALTREIVEAHGGRLQLVNRQGGGLQVRIVLPAQIG